MYVYLNKEKILDLKDIVVILEKKNKKGKKLTVIKTKEGHRYIEKRSAATIIKRFLRNYENYKKE